MAAPFGNENEADVNGEWRLNTTAKVDGEISGIAYSDGLDCLRICKTSC